MIIYHGANFEFEDIRQQVRKAMKDNKSKLITIPTDNNETYRIIVACETGRVTKLRDIKPVSEYMNMTFIGRALEKVFLVRPGDDIIYVPSRKIANPGGIRVISYLVTMQIFNRMLNIHIPVETMFPIAIHLAKKFHDVYFLSVDDLSGNGKWRPDDLTQAYQLNKVIESETSVIQDLNAFGLKFKHFEEIRNKKTTTRGVMAILYVMTAAHKEGLIPADTYQMACEQMAMAIQSDLIIHEGTILGFIGKLISYDRKKV